MQFRIIMVDPQEKSDDLPLALYLMRFLASKLDLNDMFSRMAN